MNTFKERTQILVVEKANAEGVTESLKNHDSELAVVAVCDSHLSVRESQGTFLTIRHTYYVYHVLGWEDEPNFKSLFEQAISFYLNLRGIHVRVYEQDINIIRVQVLFGHNLVKPEMANLICAKMIELKK